MKNIIKISSLGLVALLASCGKNAATPLKKIDPNAARAVAESICLNQQSIKNKELAKKPEMAENSLFEDDYFPYTANNMSADITIHNTSKMQTTGVVEANEYKETIIKKHIYLDTKNLFCHVHTSMTYTSSNPEKVTYPDNDYYFFFIENKEQDEETVETEYDKKGVYYALFNAGGLMKMMIQNLDCKKSGATSELTDFLREYSPILSMSSSEIQFNVNEALSCRLLSPVTNWNIMKAIYEEIGGTGFSSQSYEMLIMNNWFGEYFDDVIYNFIDFRDKMKDIEDKNSYFDYAFRSNDAASLGIEADAHLSLDQTFGESKMTGYMQEITSLTFRDLYLSENHFTVNYEYNTDIKEEGIEMSTYSYSSTSCDQYIKYDTNENDTYPSDYLEYAHGI